MPVASCRMPRMAANRASSAAGVPPVVRRGIRHIGVPANPYKFVDYAVRRQDEIHAAGGHGGLRHGVELGGVASCANVTPPAALMASTPAEPSEPVPDRITPIARFPHSAATTEKPVDGHMRPRRLRTGEQIRAPSSDGQIDVRRNDICGRLPPPCRQRPRRTGMAVARDRISASMLW